MEVRIKVTKVYPQESGVSAAGREWFKTVFVGEDTSQYPNTIAFFFFGNDIKAPSVGEDVLVEFDASSRQFAGRDGKERWATDLKAFRITPWSVIESERSSDVKRITSQAPAPAKPAVQFTQPAQQPYMASPQAPSVPVGPSASAPSPAPDDLPF